MLTNKQVNGGENIIYSNLWRWKGWERFCRFRGQQRKQMSGLLTKLA